MARITVEDCIDKFPSRFELVLVASNRARKLYSGEKPTVEIDNDKNTVIALREIADEKFTVDQLKNDLIEEYQTNTFSEDEDLDEIEDKSDESQVETNDLVADEKEQVGDNIDSPSEDITIDAQENSLEKSSDNDKG